jgi:hypothetical protein
MQWNTSDRSDDLSLCWDPDFLVKKGREGKSGGLPSKTVSSGNRILHGVTQEHNDTTVEEL